MKTIVRDIALVKRLATVATLLKVTYAAKALSRYLDNWLMGKYFLRLLALFLWLISFHIYSWAFKECCRTILFIFSSVICENSLFNKKPVKIIFIIKVKYEYIRMFGLSRFPCLRNAFPYLKRRFLQLFLDHLRLTVCPSVRINAEILQTI